MSPRNTDKPDYAGFFIFIASVCLLCGLLWSQMTREPEQEKDWEFEAHGPVQEWEE